ncbi:CDP-alcohol phosphatidyltransferase family protein [Rhizobium sp. LjRoot98]|uniref:CDP-alcohol phosphatidyltransferase family protein n=1 Tax=unclassified Rhizobium TaxID=2613769 RepID=UPI0007138BD1|nr:CDP-alcohol phosphatidyltransferase family protein [Rhizobium sp. Root1204]KQV41582.1 CDP-alcohol phosphatidyltransferase [Rhizobium sp. Root1204]
MSVPYSQIVLEEGSLKLANVVTVSRGLLIVPILLLESYRYLGFAILLYLAASLTDLMDGWLARRSGRASEYGARLDAIVDNIFSVAILLFLFLSFPEIALRHSIALAVLFGGPLLYLIASWFLTGKLMMFHFWSAKAGALLLFALWPVLYLTGWEDMIGLAAAVVGISRIEQIAFILRGGTNLDAPHIFATVSAP